MTVRLTQVGTKLIPENKEALVQFSRNTPVRVKLSDSVFTGNTDIVNPAYTYCLNWQDRFRQQIVQTPLTYDSTTDVCTGRVGVAATQIYGLSYVSLSATDADKEITLTTSAAEIYIPRAVDPGLAQLNTPETVGSMVEKAVADYLTEHPATTGATEKEAAQIAANTAALETKLSTTGYDSARDLAKIPIVDKNGNLAVRAVHLLIDPETDGGSLVLRGAVGQILASITMQELQEAIGGGVSPEAIKNSYWSGYKYPDGRAVLRGTYTVNNASVSSNTGMNVTNRLFNALYRKYPALFIEKPEFRATYIPDTSRVHMGVYATYQSGNSDTMTDDTYQTPPDIYLACGDTEGQTLKGVLYMTAEGRWK